MNKKLPLISLFIMSIISIFYWVLKPKEELYEAKWNAPDTTLAMAIDGEISTTFPKTKYYNTSVTCASGTGKIVWDGTKWSLSVDNITKGGCKCNISFTTRPQYFYEKILENNTIISPSTEPGKVVATDTEALLASTEDDYGTSYYFRGAVVNNYVEFANKCWRIVRITGNNAVKLVLHNNNSGNVNHPCISENNSESAAFVGTAAEFNVNYTDNTYMGFMYGTAGASSYASTHANINKSKLLTNLEAWYLSNLASYESKLADVIWCNDKSAVGDASFNPWTWSSVTNTGIGTTVSYYNALKRLSDTYNVAGGTGPSLICPNDNNGGKLSKFTVSDTTNGNGNLTYKIGALTADELAFAGYAYADHTTTIYLQENASGNTWWTITPNGYSGTNALSWYAGGTNGEFNTRRVYRESATRPAIALTSTVVVTGNGTSGNPYVVE